MDPVPACHDRVEYLCLRVSCLLLHVLHVALHGVVYDVLPGRHGLGQLDERHNACKHTKVYTHTVGFPEHDTFIVKAVTTAEQAIPLIEQGYTYDSTTPDGFNLYKKRK
jgi:hypothetical protein